MKMQTRSKDTSMDVDSTSEVGRAFVEHRGTQGRILENVANRLDIEYDTGHSGDAVPRRPDSLSWATNKLRWREIITLDMCVVGPLLGAWLPHTVRCNLGRPSQGLVSDVSLLIFILAAELRVVVHI